MLRYYHIKDRRIKPSTDFQMDNITWCDMVNPTDNDIIEISQRFNVNLEDLQDCLDENERPRYNYDFLLQNHFLLLRSILTFDLVGAGPTCPIGIILTQNGKIITIQNALTTGYDHIIDTLNRRGIESPWFLFLDIIAFLISKMEQMAQKIAARIREVQNIIMQSEKTTDIQEPFQVNSFLIYFNTAMLGNLNAYKAFFHKNQSIIEKNLILLERYDYIQTSFDQVYTFSSIYRDLMTNLLDAFSSTINNNMTNTMKVVGSIQLIVSLPTLIYSLFGMNLEFPGMIGQFNSSAVFWSVIFSSMGLSILTWIYFRKRNWL